MNASGEMVATGINELILRMEVAAVPAAGARIVRGTWPRFFATSDLELAGDAFDRPVGDTNGEHRLALSSQAVGVGPQLGEEGSDSKCGQPAHW